MATQHAPIDMRYVITDRAPPVRPLRRDMVPERQDETDPLEDADTEETEG